MRTLIALLSTGCGLLAGWCATIGAPPAAGGEVESPAPLAQQELAPPAVSGARTEVSAPEQPREDAAAAAESLGPVPVPAADAPARLPSLSADAVGRRYFHAQVAVEELARFLPEEEEARTPERFPGWFAALAERDRLGADLARLDPPAIWEPLPVLDLDAQGGDLDRIFRGASREELLFEQWSLGRFAYAEAKRLLDREHSLAVLGPLPEAAPGTFG